MGLISFINADVKYALPGKTGIRKLINEIFKDKQLDFEEISVIFCSDEFLLTLNKDYLKHNYYTDILTFDLSASPSVISGELYISIDRTLENSTIHKVSHALETYRVIIHGILHLCGYKDKTKKDQLAIRKQEDLYLSKIIVPRGT